MKISAYHSHLNGRECLAIHHEDRWREIDDAVHSVSILSSSSSVSIGGGRDSDANATTIWTELGNQLLQRGWHESQPAYMLKERVGVRMAQVESQACGISYVWPHMAFFVGDVIDVGVEIVPMKELQAEMSSGPPHYEGCLYDLIRQGRSTPAVPLVLIGIAP